MQQRLRPTRFSALIVLTLLFAASTQSVSAQGPLKWRLHGGMMRPTAVGASYFSMGPSISVDAAYPLADKVAVVLDLGWDYLNTDDTHPTPVTNMWRYRAELEGSLLGDADSGLSVKAFAGAGGTTLYSHKFWLVSQQAKHLAEDGVAYTFDGERLRGNALTGTGGLRLGVHSPDGIQWWLTGKVNYTKLNQFNSDALHELSTNRFEPQGLDPIKSVMNFAVQLGVSL